MPTEQELLQQLGRNIDGAAVITSTVRASALRQQYSRQQQAAGHHRLEKSADSGVGSVAENAVGCRRGSRI